MGDSQVINRYSAAATRSSISLKASIGRLASSLIAPGRTAARRRGLVGALLVVMSMGMTVMVVVTTMLVMLMTGVMVMIAAMIVQ